MELARANLVASNAPTSFWTYAVLHATDILNRTTGPPPRLSISSYEALTGRSPASCQSCPSAAARMRLNRVPHSLRRAWSRALGWV
eukprot:5934541-Pleurochrysis_carterae.AAC.1